MSKIMETLKEVIDEYKLMYQALNETIKLVKFMGDVIKVQETRIVVLEKKYSELQGG